MSAEEVRATAVEAVRQHLEISEETRIKTSIRNAWLIVSAIAFFSVTGGWTVCAYLDRINASQIRMEGVLLYKVPESELVAWSNALDKANRTLEQKDGTLGLNVPDPILYRPSPLIAGQTP